MVSKKRVEKKPESAGNDVEHDILEQLEMLEALAMDDEVPDAPSSRKKSTNQESKSEKNEEHEIFDELYDEHADSEDERWVRDNLMPRSLKHGDDRYHLACPSCFILLCVQCQPHERYAGQFRALDVRNCVVKEGDDANIVPQNLGLKKVVCKECETDVAVLDKEGTYIFCNVAH